MDPLADFSQDLRYPIGPFVPASYGIEARRQSVEALSELPDRLTAALHDLVIPQLNTPYREGGWTLCQLAHHVADSHLNAYTRVRLALTEDWPVIKPYHQELWAELPDARQLPVEPSLALLAALHTRWVTLLSSLNESDWSRGYIHPESGRTSIETMTALYSWHGRHHTAHVLALRARMGW